MSFRRRLYEYQLAMGNMVDKIKRFVAGVRLPADSFMLSVLGLAVVVIVLAYSQYIASTLRQEEEKHMQTWAEATRLMAQVENPGRETVEFCLEIIKQNEHIPVMICDSLDNVWSYRNLGFADSLLSGEQLKARLDVELSKMKEHGRLMLLNVGGDEELRLYYSESENITVLQYFPLVQLALIVIFVLYVYVLLVRSRRAEQNSLWVGLARETAHQLGTPITALVGWQQLLAEDDESMTKEEIASEMQKDIVRLQKIAERFQKMGGEAQMQETSVKDTVEGTVEYLRRRVPKRINIDFEVEGDVAIRHNSILIGWAIENMCKNAIDAIDGNGQIVISVWREGERCQVRIIDNGRGMSGKTAGQVFRAGYTTKKRGWGIGLALAKRIVEEQHGGRIWVEESKPGVGTVMAFYI